MVSSDAEFEAGTQLTVADGIDLYSPLQIRMTRNVNSESVRTNGSYIALSMRGFTGMFLKLSLLGGVGFASACRGRNESRNSVTGIKPIQWLHISRPIDLRLLSAFDDRALNVLEPAKERLIGEAERLGRDGWLVDMLDVV